MKDRIGVARPSMPRGQDAMNRSHRRNSRQSHGGSTAAATEHAALLREAVACHQAGRLQEAEEGYQMLLALDPNHADALHLLGVKNHQVGRNDEACRLIGRAIDVSSERPVYHNNLALVLQALNQPNEAVVHLRRAAELDAGYADARYNLGKCLQDMGDYDQAARQYEAAIALDPRHAEAWSNLGTIFQLQGRYAEAEDAQRRATAANPDLPQVHYNLGNALRSLCRRAEAVEAYQCALSLEPNHRDAWYNLGVTQKELGRSGEAIASLRRACQLDSGNAGILRVLGLTYQENGDNAAAVATIRQAIAIDPDNGSGHHLLAAFTGETTDRAPEEYVRNLFDDYAGRFEGELVDQLGYRGPTQLRELLNDIGDDLQFSRAIDLGCGSGLAGEVFHDMCDNLCGVDLAPKMIEQARAKGCYQELAAADVVAYLNQSHERYDLFIAADAVVYLGDLEPLFAAAVRRADDSALVLLTTELAADGDFTLLPSGRYAHSEAYLRQLAECHGMEVSAVKTVNLRREHNAWIRGQAIALRCQRKVEDYRH